MKTATGKFIGTGARGAFFDCGFRPKWVIVGATAAQNVAVWDGSLWMSRTNGLGAVDSVLDGLRVDGSRVYLGTAARVNASAGSYYWAAIGEDGSDDFEVQDWLGNATAGRVVSLRTPKSPIAAIIKRDSTLPAVMRVGSAATMALDGTAVANSITALSSGSVTLGAANEVNQYDSAGGLGEGINGLFVYDGSNAQAVTWSGAANGQVIPTTVDPLFAIIYRTDAPAVGWVVTRDMPAGFAKPVGATALTANTVSLQPGGIKIGSATTLQTGSFAALVFGRTENKERFAPAISIKGKKGIYFPGRGTASQVVCGNSDATLKISGAISIEWFGVCWPESSTPTSDVTFLARGAGPAGSAGAYSWGLGGVHRSDINWGGAMVSGIISSQFNTTAPLDSSVWRTGLHVPNGLPVHYVMTHDGSGEWRLYINGRLQKQAKLPASVNVGGSGHYTAFGMRPNTGGTYTNAQRQIAMAGRVYSRALTADEVAARYAREALGSAATSDVTSGLAEAWDFSSASGVLLPATVSAANNGAISAAANIVSL